MSKKKKEVGLIPPEKPSGEFPFKRVKSNV